MIKNQLEKIIQKTLKNLDIKYKDDIIIQDPRNQANVHYSTNIAMLLTKQLKMPPIDIANTLVDKIIYNETDFFEKISIAKPGFINFKINASEYSKHLRTILKNGNNFGKSNIGEKLLMVGTGDAGSHIL